MLVFALQVGIARLLLAYGADPHCAGSEALRLAAQRGALPVLRVRGNKWSG
jgi:hypothetical protein